ncbi:MAG TPA: ABC transporter permease [Candidatus Methylomirabilis sp.]|nr:ABC transporter permease [Candidatus Methylomirabilis sp.]
MRARALIQLWRLLILAAFFLAWEYGTGILVIREFRLFGVKPLSWVDPFFISTPSLIVRRFVFLISPQAKVTLWARLAITLQNTFIGFGVGVGSGFLVGLILGRNETLARIFEPFIIAVNTLPRIALVPLVTMMFGLGSLSKVIMAWLIVFFIVFFNTFQGARSVDRDLVNAARLLGASRLEILRTVVIPSTLAWTFTALTPSISFALIGVVIGEFIGGDSGIGYLIILSLATLESADMMVALLLLAAVGITLALGIQMLERRLLRWQARYQAE